MYTSFNLAAAAYTPVRLIVRKIRYLFIEFTENVLYRDIYRYRDMNNLYRDMIFWSYRPALTQAICHQSGGVNVDGP